MALGSTSDLVPFAAQAAQRDILLWTTRDGREIPLDEMSDDHIANAVRVLTVWRSRLKTRGDGDDGVMRDLKAAITRFKELQRRRRKAQNQDSRKAQSRSTAPADDDGGITPVIAQTPGSVRPNFKRDHPSSDARQPHASGRSSSGFARRRKPVAST